jgi:hypothetical protein
MAIRLGQLFSLSALHYCSFIVGCPAVSPASQPAKIAADSHFAAIFQPALPPGNTFALMMLSAAFADYFST